MIDLSEFFRFTGLALADFFNPCAIAFLTMILMSILIKNPGKKEKVLYAGLSFILAVYVGYLFYGIIIVQFFKSFAEVLRDNSGFVFNGLAIFSMIIGALNIKDYFLYKKGGIATEMPIFLRPKVKKIIDGITSPFGAFFTGFLITLFLLPCTIGPYIVASGLLADKIFLIAIFWLLYYNLVFVLPMLIIVGIIYFGFVKVDEVSGWKESNIRLLHLIAGILLFVVGFSLLIGWL